jgi:hypothetical protein
MRVLGWLMVLLGVSILLLFAFNFTIMANYFPEPHSISVLTPPLRHASSAFIMDLGVFSVVFGWVMLYTGGGPRRFLFPGQADLAAASRAYQASLVMFLVLLAYWWLKIDAALRLEPKYGSATLETLVDWSDWKFILVFSAPFVALIAAWYRPAKPYFLAVSAGLWVVPLCALLGPQRFVLHLSMFVVVLGAVNRSWRFHPPGRKRTQSFSEDD